MRYVKTSGMPEIDIVQDQVFQVLDAGMKYIFEISRNLFSPSYSRTYCMKKKRLIFQES